MTAHAFPLIIVNRGAAAPQQPVRLPHKAASKPQQPMMSNKDRQAIRAGVLQERRRWQTVLGSKAFSAQPVAAAHLLARTDKSAAEIIATLRNLSADAVDVPLTELNKLSTLPREKRRASGEEAA